MVDGHFVWKKPVPGLIEEHHTCLPEMTQPLADCCDAREKLPDIHLFGSDRH